MGDNVPQAENTEKTEEANDGPKTFSQEEVESHNTKTDIWIIIRDKVYDVTKFLEEVSDFFVCLYIVHNNYELKSRLKEVKVALLLMH